MPTLPSMLAADRKPVRRIVPNTGLLRDLVETQRDINTARKGGETEASVTEMRATKRRIIRDLRKADRQERRESARENNRALDPLMPAKVYRNEPGVA